MFYTTLMILAVANGANAQDCLNLNRTGSTGITVVEFNQRQGEVTRVKDLCAISRKIHNGSGEAIKTHSDVLGAMLVRNLSEDSVSTCVGSDVHLVVRVGRASGDTAVVDLRVDIFASNVRVDATIITYDLDDCFFQRNLRVRKSLPVVAVRECLTVNQ